MFKRKPSDRHLISSLFFAFAILLFHVFLLAAIGLLVLIFRGIVNYFLWILLAGGLLAGGGFFLLYRLLQKEKSAIARLLELPEFRDRRVEVNLLGGLASVKIGEGEAPAGAALDEGPPAGAFLLEDPNRAFVRELSDLARLLEKNLISMEEYNRAKNLLLATDAVSGCAEK
jgi:hypothetical protein